MQIVNTIDNLHGETYTRNMIRRTITDKILRWVEQYPVVTITGPRQSGKTTLCRMLFHEREYINLESPDIRDFVRSDPRGFLDRYREGAVIDEIQRAPELLSYLQVEVDRDPQPGRFILTGSQNFLLMESLSQSLAGRTALAELLPFSLEELSSAGIELELDQLLCTGFYPRIHDNNLDPAEALSFYVRTYVERDLRQLITVRDLSQFELFLKLCAGRMGQILNLSALGNDCGVSHNTIKSWISILESSYIIKLLHPFFRNFNKRLIKSPKLYFLDPGLAAYLLNIRTPEQMRIHPLRGFLFESLVISELYKMRYNAGQGDNLYFFRDSAGNEVDIILDHGLQQDILEIKSAQTITSDFFKGLEYLSNLNNSIRNRYLVYGGKEQRNQRETEVLGWRNMNRITANT